ncbi:MAG: hypothetical protein QM774_00415 [Gordonia sp. (in: high G+C Gram-positive bacteria)]|uniref:hypothetical protein n=1 Tax=Gordonia sp. (in: high G+C Gram-positive bacteria) TaxID=84139 RepID=UPI0039E22C34
MRKYLPATLLAVTAAAGAAVLGAGPAAAWDHTTSHIGVTASLDGGNLKLAVTNNLDQSAVCTALVFAPDRKADVDKFVALRRDASTEFQAGHGQAGMTKVKEAYDFYKSSGLNKASIGQADPYAAVAKGTNHWVVTPDSTHDSYVVAGNCEVPSDQDTDYEGEDWAVATAGGTTSSDDAWSSLENLWPF